MDIGRAFSYPFEDAEWARKVVIGAVLSLIPIVNFATVGYALHQMKAIAEGRWVPLPEWDNFGDKFVDGLILSIGVLIWTIPSWVIGGASLVPLVLSAISGREPGLAAGAGILALMVAGLWLLVVGVAYPAMAMNFAVKRTFGACFEIAAIVDFITRDAGSYALGIVAYLGAAILVGILSSVPLVGFLVAAAGGFYILLVVAGAYGQHLAGALGTAGGPAETTES